MSIEAVLVLRAADVAEEGCTPPQWDSNSSPPEHTKLLLHQSLPLGKDNRVVVSKKMLADSVGLGDTTAAEPFSLTHPMFGQFIRLTDDYDSYYIVPRKGWNRVANVHFSYTVSKGGVTQSVVGTLSVEQASLASLMLLLVEVFLSVPCPADVLFRLPPSIPAMLQAEPTPGCFSMIFRKWRARKAAAPKETTSKKHGVGVEPLKQSFLHRKDEAKRMFA